MQVRNQTLPQGTQADMAAGVDIGKVLGGYFNDDATAEQFFAIGVLPNLAGLPKVITIVDLGGGQGTLLSLVKEKLIARGYTVNAVLYDANPAYVEAARRKNLDARLFDIATLDERAIADIVIMRSVLQYNPPETQKQILRIALNFLKPGGLFVNQCLSGTKASTQLRREILALPQLHREGNYYFIPIHELVTYHRAVGFQDVNLAGCAKPGKSGPAEYWERFVGTRMRHAEASRDTAILAVIRSEEHEYTEQTKKLVELYREQYGDEQCEVQEEAGKYFIVSQYPIVTARAT